MKEPSFNVLDEPWIPCMDLQGNYRNFGIRDLLAAAHELRAIRFQNPLSDVAVLRVLLAVIHRAINGPRNGAEWKNMYSEGRFGEQISGYLDRWHHRFDLFSNDKPFYQTPGLAVVDATGREVPQTAGLITLGISSGNNKTLFDHTLDDAPVRLTPAEAAASLLTAQMFSLGGLNKKTTNLFGYQQSFLNGAMVNGIFIILTGNILFETLMLNLLIYDGGNEPIPVTPQDCPVWEREDLGVTSATTPRGYLDYLTCKCRHIRLVPSSIENETTVEYVHLAQGEAFPMVENPGVFRRKNKKGEWYAPSLDVNRLVWRDSTALFAFDDHDDRRPKAFVQIRSFRRIVDLPSRYLCSVYGLANEKANPLAWRRETLDVPISLLFEKSAVAYLKKAMDLAEKTYLILNQSVKIYMKEYLPEKSKDVSEKAKSTRTVDTFWDRTEGYFHQFLREMDSPDQAAERWHEALKKTAMESLNLCLDGRYRNTARTFRAWNAAVAYLSTRLDNIVKGGTKR